MDEMRRRAFCTLAAASMGLAAGCDSVTREEFTATGSDVLVTTQGELESAFAGLSTGDTIYISAENAPYRTTGWLDIDTDGVSVVGPGVRTLLEPADGANVGGFRIGHGRRCRGIDIRGVGYHGNPEGQRASAARLHAVAVRNARDVTIAGNRIRGTHPRRHGDGGSGISVANSCTGVSVFANRISDYGDRGIQLGGSRHAVFANTVTDGLDRPISCDLWYPDGTNRTARSVAVFGNLLGDSYEGSLVGIARNEPLGSNEGFLSVFGNVGFGSHKSFCHLRGPAPLRNVSVRDNVSVQETDRLRTERTTAFSGIAVDVAEGENITIGNNELSGYSGHGIRVESAVTGLGVRRNHVFAPSRDGIRLDGGADGIVEGNLLVRPGAAGIRLGRTGTVAVDGNYVREAGTVGILAEGPGTTTDIARNDVTANGRNADRAVPGIRVHDSGLDVRGNVVKRHDGPAIAEADGTGNNRYADNRSDGDRPWRIPNPTSVVRDHVPPVDVHRGVTAAPESDTVEIAFDRPYARAPRLAFGRTGGGISEREFETDGEGNFVGVTVRTRRDGATIDLFVGDG